MKTKIISAFPGTGKSFYHEKNKEFTLDSDSSHFSWIYHNGQKIRNPDFPNNYISHIKENIGKYKYIFVSSHIEVRKALLDNCLFFYLFYPSKNAKAEYISRFRERQSSEEFIQLVSNNWNNWIDEIENGEYLCGFKCVNIGLQYVEDFLC